MRMPLDDELIRFPNTVVRETGGVV